MIFFQRTCHNRHNKLIVSNDWAMHFLKLVGDEKKKHDTKLLRHKHLSNIKQELGKGHMKSSCIYIVRLMRTYSIGRNLQFYSYNQMGRVNLYLIRMYVQCTILRLYEEG